MIGDMLQGLIESVRAEERKNYVLRILAVIGAIAAIAAIAYGIYRFLTPDYFDDYEMISMMKTLTMISTTTSRKRKRLPLRRNARQIKIDR